MASYRNRRRSPEPTETITLSVERVVFQSPNSPYAVVVGMAGSEEITATGTLGRPKRNEVLEIAGKWEKHPKYGRQFCGVATTYHSRLQDSHKNLRAWGRRAGWPESLLKKIADLTPAQAIAAEANPYTLMDLWLGLPWPLVDKLAEVAGLGRADALRVEAGVDWILQQWPRSLRQIEDQTAGCWAPWEPVLREAAALLELDKEAVEQALIEHSPTSLTPIELPAPAIMRTRLHRAEERILGKVGKLQDVGGPKVGQSEVDPKLSQEQAKAVLTSSNQGIAAIYGPPGVGKTQCVREIQRIHLKAGIPVLLAAPTGKAADRLNQVCEGKTRASTIHRLLCCSPCGSGFTFAYNGSNPLPGPCAIVTDENSMVPLELMDSLLAAVAPGSRLILVGDINQIRPVAPGQPFIDLIQSEAISSSPLTKIFRQAEGSAIAEACKLVLDGEPHEFFSFIRSAAAQEEILFRPTEDEQLAQVAISMLGSFSAPVLCPTNKGPAGTVAINRAIQACRFGGGSPMVALDDGRAYHQGDVVMQIRNDYSRNARAGVFNGDTGRAAGLLGHKLLVQFEDGGAVEEYDKAQVARDLTLAYAISIHKSQGSEWERVVIVLPESTGGFLNRSLLYTALSRAKRHLTILGSVRAIQRALGQELPKAETRLGWMLRQG